VYPQNGTSPTRYGDRKQICGWEFDCTKEGFAQSEAFLLQRPYVFKPPDMPKESRFVGGRRITKPFKVQILNPFFNSSIISNNS